MTIKHASLIGIVLVIAVALLLVLFFLIPKDEELIVVPAPIVEEPIVEPELSITSKVIGTSVEEREITVHSLGNGDTHLLFVGGMHGGYEWNSVLLAYEMIDHLTNNPELIPDTLTIDIIPAINPDGLYEVLGIEGKFSLSDVPNPEERIASGRFNARNVDLNRNFDCKWAPQSTWRGEVVSAGTAAFSEPEAAALRDFVAQTDPEAVIFWHSKANNVYASECENGVLPETLTLMSTYARAALYGEVPVFDAYPITGDAEGWLASLGIPAVTVEFESHDSIEWERNLAGTMATIQLYSSPTTQ